jgi:hypothetical protein
VETPGIRPERQADRRKEVLALATTVIIPARNEESTIGEIVKTFNRHPETADRIFVGIDRHTTDETAAEVWSHGGCAYHTDQHGKGQVVVSCLMALQQENLLSTRIILCDADYTGLKIEHIHRMLNVKEGMAIGVPDFPECWTPDHVINAWPQISGFRYLPRTLIPADAHGYMLETQLNLAAIKARMPVRHVFLDGLKSPFQWPPTDRRRQARELDRQWGIRHGIFKP